MLKRLAILVAMLVLIPFQADCQTHKAKQGQTSQQPSTPVAVMPVQQDNSPSLQPKPEQHIEADVRVIKAPDKDGYDIAAFWISAILAGVGIGGVGIGVCTLLFLRNQTIQIRRQADMAVRQARLISTQAKQMEEQTKILGDSVAIAKKSADAAEMSAKAAMGTAIPILRLEEFRFLPSANQTLSNDLEMPHIYISVKNYGQTPAFLKSFAVEFTCEGMPNVLKYPSFLHFDPEVVLDSGASYPLEESGVCPWKAFSQADADAILEGKKTLSVYGCIWYGDVFNPTLHKLAFSRYGVEFSGGVMWIDPEITYDDGKSEAQEAGAPQ